MSSTEKTINEVATTAIKAALDIVKVCSTREEAITELERWIAKREANS